MDTTYWKREILKIVRGARNGFYYGTKVRFMHAIVMALLFAKKPLPIEIKRIFKLALHHGSKLALYISLYKLSLLIFKSINNSEKNKKIHFFLSGAICGYFVYKNPRDALNVQMILYLLSRDITGGLKNLQYKKIIPQFDFFPFIATLSWGLVMYLYKVYPETLQFSLKRSMDFLYKNSEHFKHWTELVPFFVPKSIVGFVDSRFRSVN